MPCWKSRPAPDADLSFLIRLIIFMNLLDAPESRKLFGLENSGENETPKRWGIVGLLV